jgi:Flp pilus assembly protein TadD
MLQLNPRDPRIWNVFDVTANAYITAGNYEKAAELARDSIQRRPDNAMSHLYLAVALGQLDRIDEAQSELATAQGVDPEIVPRHESIRPQKYAKDRENFLDGLRKAGWED